MVKMNSRPHLCVGGIVAFAAMILWYSVSASQVDSTILKRITKGQIQIGGLRAHGFASRH